MADRPTDKIETFFEEQGSLRRPGFVGRAVRSHLLWSTSASQGTGGVDLRSR